MRYVLIIALMLVPSLAFAHNGINHHAEKLDLVLIVIASILSISNAVRINRKERSQLSR